MTCSPSSRRRWAHDQAALVSAPAAIRSGADADWPAIHKLLTASFLSGTGTSSMTSPGVFEASRSLLATRGDHLAGHAGCYTRDLAVPGGTVPAAHVALVAVAHGDRRQGILSGLMRRQLADAREAGREPVALLWASEARIYQRFGYGLAAWRLNLTADLREVRPRAPSPEAGPVRELDPGDARPLLRAVYSRAWRQRPGWSSRSEPWWDRATRDLPEERHGASPLRVLSVAAPGGAEGYALWRGHGDWDDDGPAGQVEMRELVADGPAAAAALWCSLLSVDLARSLRYPLAAVDDPVLSLADEPRRLRATLADALWVRLLDVPAALAARQYLTPVDVVINVRDPLLPANSGGWRLAADEAGASCERTRSRPDLTAGVEDLAAAYLGGTSLAMSGRVAESRRGALAACSAAFRWHREPSAIEMF
jgi:predicted acetyltransferase